MATEESREQGGSEAHSAMATEKGKQTSKSHAG